MSARWNDTLPGPVRAFVVSEARTYGRAFLRTALGVSAVLSVGWTVYAFFAIDVRSTAAPGVNAVVDAVLATIVLAVMSIPWALAAGAVAGAACVLWRAAGAWAFVPFVAIPSGIALALWLAVPLFRLEPVLLGEGMRAAGSVFDNFAGPARAGGAGAVILLVLFLSLLFIDLALFLLHPAVLLPTLLLLGTTCAVVLAGASVAGAPTLALAVLAFVRRTRARFAELSSGTR
jgi:hypothetical protein